MKKLLLLIFLFCSCNTLFAKGYIFFLHNMFLELSDINAVHPEYGKCEYYEIIAAFKKKKFTVISEIRPRGTDVQVYARKVVAQIDSLMKRGVKPSEITVLGTSKGSYIAQYVSTYLENPEVNFVFIGACNNDMPAEINYCGNILSIYERSDVLGQSCRKVKETATNEVRHFKEIELNTGLKHGFLYKALPAWLEPAMQWANGNYD